MDGQPGATFSSTNSGVATSTTNANGAATAPLLNNNLTRGTYSLTASAAGAGTVTFNLANAGAPYPEFDLQVSQAVSPQSVTVGSPLTYDIIVSNSPSVMGGCNSF